MRGSWWILLVAHRARPSQSSGRANETSARSVPRLKLLDVQGEFLSQANPQLSLVQLLLAEDFDPQARERGWDGPLRNGKRLLNVLYCWPRGMNCRVERERCALSGL